MFKRCVKIILCCKFTVKLCISVCCKTANFRVNPSKRKESLNVRCSTFFTYQIIINLCKCENKEAFFMSIQNLQDRIHIFKSLFKGRDDVFAIRWEKGNKSGYMPAYFFDPN